MNYHLIKFMEWHGYFWSTKLNRFITQKEAVAIYGCDVADIFEIFGEKNER